MTTDNLSDRLLAGAAATYVRLSRLANGAVYRKLRDSSRQQIETFAREAAEFPSLLAQLSQPFDERLVSPAWQQSNREVARAFDPAPPLHFLQNHAIRNTMVFSRPGAARQIESQAVIDSDIFRRRPDIVREDYAGVPPLFALEGEISSTNLVHHLFHLTRLEAALGAIDDYRNIIEWGGGYGDLAKLVCRLSPTATYTIVDTPLFSSLQAIYLRTTLGRQRVNVVSREAPDLRTGAVNIVALPFLDGVGAEFDLFVATWSLSESPKLAQDLVFERKFLGARKTFFGCQLESHLFPDAQAFSARLRSAGYRTEPIAFLPGNVYAWGA